MSNNSRLAIKHIELMQEQIKALEQQNINLSEQLNVAICILCSNKGYVVLEYKDGHPTYSLHVGALDGTETGAFSPEKTAYEAVLTGIEEYIEYMEEQDEYNAE